MDLLLHLRGLVAVADELHVSRAAEVIGVDQPLLSRRLRALERHLDVELLDRSRRQIALTPAATVLLPRARQLLAQADSLVGTARGTRDHPELGLAVPAGADPAALADALGLLREHRVPAALLDPAGDGPRTAARWEVQPCDPAEATWTTALGIAVAGASRGAVPARLVDLRPRRGDDGPVLLVTADDTRAPWWRHVRSALDRAGFSPRHLLHRPEHLAAAQALGGRDRVLASQHQARRLRLGWTPVEHRALRRGHRLAEVGDVPALLRSGRVRHEVLQALGRSVGAA